MKRKRSKFLFLLLILFVIFLIILYKPYSYNKTYKIDNYSITETYDKDNKIYKFIIDDNIVKYAYIVNNKYTSKRKLINKIDTYSKEDEVCIIPISNNITFYPLCSKDNIVYTYNNSNIKDIYDYEEVSGIDRKYNNIKEYYLNNKKYLIYNYKGFYLIGDNKEIKLFNKDIYNIDLVYELNNKLIIPDYNNNYYFDKLYVINILNGRKKEIRLEEKISFDSVFLGDYKNSIYLLDKKEEKEYKIDIKKLKIEETDFYILDNNKLVKSNFKYISNNNIVFPKDSLYRYEIIDNYLYEIIDNNKIKLSNNKVDKIIKENNSTVYYLVKDNLYMYNNKKGEVLLLNYFEWNFKNTNMIFISE